MISVFGSKVGKEELDEIKTSIDNQWIGIGPKVKKFEELFSQRLNLNGFVMLDSGSNALCLAIKLLDLPKGSEVILPAFTWISCASAVMLNDLKPVFCDVDIDTCNITPDTIIPKITNKTRAIMEVHYGGLPVDMEAINHLGFPIIEDAAHAVDSKIGDRYCGSFSDVGIYSFDGVKNLAIGEAGGITGSDEFIERAAKLRYCGISKSGFEASANKDRWWEYEVNDIYYKMIPDDISASIGLAQLKKLDDLQTIRKLIWRIYQSEFKTIGWFNTPPEPAVNIQHSYFTYFIKLNIDKRDELAKYLYDKGIYTTLRYQPLHLIPIYKSKAKLPNCEHLNQYGLNLPIHPNMYVKDVDYIIDCIKKFKHV